MNRPIASLFGPRDAPRQHAGASAWPAAQSPPNPAPKGFLKILAVWRPSGRTPAVAPAGGARQAVRAARPSGSHPDAAVPSTLAGADAAAAAVAPDRKPVRQRTSGSLRHPARGGAMGFRLVRIGQCRALCGVCGGASRAPHCSGGPRDEIVRDDQVDRRGTLKCRRRVPRRGRRHPRRGPIGALIYRHRPREERAPALG